MLQYNDPRTSLYYPDPPLQYLRFEDAMDEQVYQLNRAIQDLKDHQRHVVRTEWPKLCISNY